MLRRYTLTPRIVGIVITTYQRMDSENRTMEGEEIRMRKNPLECHHCQQTLELGDRIVSKTGQSGRMKMYHLSCAKRLLIV